MTGSLAPPAPPRLGRGAVAAVMAALMLGLLLGALDQMIVAAVMRTVADQLDGLTLQAWATTAYLITGVVSTPLYGRLSDIYGRKPLYLASISLFLLGSLLCAAAQSMYGLAAFRAVQGLGAGGLMALAFAILADLLPPERRSRYQAWFGAVFGVSSVAGPVLGGLFAGMDDLLGMAGWRWAFLVNVPVGLVALVLVVTLYRLPHTRTAQRVDYGGAATLLLGLVPLLAVAGQGGAWGWSAPRTLVLAAVGVAGLAGFVLVERRMGDAALLPPRLFTSRLFTVSSAVNVVVGMGVFGGLAVLPLYLQIVKGLSPTAAGLMLLPQTLGIVAAGRLSGPFVTRTRRYKGLLLLGLATMTACAFAFARLAPGTPLWFTGFVAALMGLGIGLCFQVMLIAVQASAPAGAMGAASASYTFFRQIGGTAGTAVYLTILFSLAEERITAALHRAQGTAAFQAALAGDPGARRLLDGADLDDTSYLGHLDPRLARPVLEGMASAMDTVFVVVGCVMAAGLVLALFLKEQPRD
ncbi:DHA2 family efflux MFS transporter permease subunit [Actinomadura macrotermitis]|uniref:Multidrug resistance protein 3 n=1 Tax=Actinomadura macrotermitis TaxID=2585200 RepID=A0A7K0BWR1_9ACTN|nr:DHA2 family efflux MFS transporter permease subunit [Actinomadura macrotermitis]MQY05607.1 Multidrug resistance protein 3 [Actinomadura macrotermitis]